MADASKRQSIMDMLSYLFTGEPEPESDGTWDDVFSEAQKLDWGGPPPSHDKAAPPMTPDQAKSEEDAQRAELRRRAQMRSLPPAPDAARKR